MNDNWEEELSGEVAQDGQDEALRVNADQVFMERYGIVNNVFYTMFTAPMDYFRICILSLLFLDMQKRVRRTAMLLLVGFALTNRAIGLTNNVMFNTVELLLTAGIVITWFILLDKFNISGNAITYSEEEIETAPDLVDTTDHDSIVHDFIEEVQPTQAVDTSASLEDILKMVTQSLDTTRSVSSTKMEDHLANTLMSISNLKSSDFSWLETEDF